MELLWLRVQAAIVRFPPVFFCASVPILCKIGCWACSYKTIMHKKKRLNFQSLAIKTFAVRRGLDRRAERRWSGNTSENQISIYSRNPHIKWVVPTPQIASERSLHFVQDRLLSLLIQDYYAQKKATEFQSLAIKTSAVRRGLEPLTPCVTGTYSNQLN